MMLLLGLLCTIGVVTLSFPLDYKQLDEPLFAIDNDTICILCQETAKLVQDIIDSNGTVQDVIEITLPVCYRLLKGQRKAILCPGTAEAYGPVIIYVMSHKLIKPYDLCSRIHLCSPLKRLNDNLNDKTSDSRVVLQRSLKFNNNNTTTAHTYNNPRWNLKLKYSNNTKYTNALKIVQFNDVHLDPYYKEGTATDCGLFVCCRPWQPGNGTAGYYGDYQCDLPLVTFDLLLEAIKSADPDFIIYGGDNPPHDFWNETVQGQLAFTKYIVKRTASILSDKNIYPTIGNHETYPESEYLGTLSQYQDMTKQIAQYWQDWVEFPQESLETIATGGYYTLMIKDGLRLISLNSDYWYGLNFYSFLNEENPLYSKQVDWLNDTFRMAERNNEKVLLLAHIPSGDSDNLPSYGDIILNITKRYKQIIVGILSAHTHNDQFELIQDIDGIHGVTLISPSATTFGDINPSFRIYYMDKTSYELIDYEQYHLDIQKANELRTQGDVPVFELAYTASEEYSIPDISPNSWGALVERFEEYSDLVQRYYYNFYGRSKPFGACDSKCQRHKICEAKNCNSLDYFRCVIDSEHD